MRPVARYVSFRSQPRGDRRDLEEAALENLMLLLSGRLQKNGVLDRKSQSDFTRQLLNDMPVEHPATNDSYTLAHHFEQDILSFLADRDHVSYIHSQSQAPCWTASVVPFFLEFRHPG